VNPGSGFRGERCGLVDEPLQVPEVFRSQLGLEAVAVEHCDLTTTGSTFRIDRSHSDNQEGPTFVRLEKLDEPMVAWPEASAAD
jgi:hypothetical protein